VAEAKHQQRHIGDGYEDADDRFAETAGAALAILTDPEVVKALRAAGKLSRPGRLYEALMNCSDIDGLLVEDEGKDSA
jgi:flagellar biosynthesis regulator FlbT